MKLLPTKLLEIDLAKAHIGELKVDQLIVDKDESPGVGEGAKA